MPDSARPPAAAASQGLLTCCGPRGLHLRASPQGAPAEDEGITPVDSSTVAPPPAGPPTPRRPGTESILTLVGGVLAGVGGVFAGTHSVLVTVIATAAAIVLTAMVLAMSR